MEHPPLSVAEDGVDVPTMIRQINALMSYYLHIPFPERLSDEDWIEKYAQIEWLTKKNIIGK